MGTDPENQPKYICGVEYIGKKRHKLIIYKMDDVIKFFDNYKFMIRKSKTVIELGKALTLQRKGGDSGKKTSNQLQFKLVFSYLEIENKLEYLF